MNKYSVVIIGGGPAGCACAIALAQKGIRNVLILEAGNYDKFVIGESISPDSTNLLKKLNVYADFLQEGHLPCYGTCSYWGDDRRGYNDTVLSPYGHGWHLDRNKFNLFLSNKAQQEGALLETNSVYQSHERKASGVTQVKYLNNGKLEQVLTDIIVDASGFKGVVAQENGSQKLQDKSLICVSRRFQLAKGNTVSSLTRIEAVENGWWYGAKLPSDQMLIAFYTNKEELNQSSMHDTSTWMENVQKAPSIIEGVALGEAIDNNIIGHYAPSYCLDKVVGDNWLAIGDAASAYDPITSRGIFKSLTHACFAAEVISHMLLGNRFAAKDFEKFVKDNFTSYLDERVHYYQLEKRWSQHPFWSSLQEKNQEVESC